MTDQEITRAANGLAVQRLLERHLGAQADYQTFRVAGATVIAEPSRRRSGIPLDAKSRRYTFTHLGAGWSMAVRAVWRGDRLHEPAAIHTRVEHLWDDTGRHHDDETLVAAAVNDWLRSLPL